MNSFKIERFPEKGLQFCIPSQPDKRFCLNFSNSNFTYQKLNGVNWQTFFVNGHVIVSINAVSDVSNEFAEFFHKLKNLLLNNSITSLYVFDETCSWVFLELFFFNLLEVIDTLKSKFKLTTLFLKKKARTQPGDSSDDFIFNVKLSISQLLTLNTFTYLCLDVYDPKFQNAAIAQISNTSFLTHLILMNHMYIHFDFKKLPLTLEFLKIRGNSGLHESWLSDLYDYLKSTTMLRKLSIDGLVEVAASDFPKNIHNALVENRSLKTLCLRNKLGIPYYHAFKTLFHNNITKVYLTSIGQVNFLSFLSKLMTLLYSRQNLCAIDIEKIEFTHVLPELRIFIEKLYDVLFLHGNITRIDNQAFIDVVHRILPGCHMSDIFARNSHNRQQRKTSLYSLIMKQLCITTSSIDVVLQGCDTYSYLDDSKKHLLVNPPKGKSSKRQRIQ